jgi:hypothetical protein
MENNNFARINKEANKIWQNALSGLEKSTSESISKAYASMSPSQKEAARVQRNVAARLFNDQESALNNIKKGGIKNPSLAELGNNLIWGIYHATGKI